MAGLDDGWARSENLCPNLHFSEIDELLYQFCNNNKSTTTKIYCSNSHEWHSYTCETEAVCNDCLDRVEDDQSTNSPAPHPLFEDLSSIGKHDRQYEDC